MRENLFAACLLIYYYLFVSQAAFADPSPGGKQASTAFSLDIEDSRTRLSYSGLNTPARLSRFGITWRETLSPYLQGIVRAGVQELTLSEALLPSAKYSGGNYLSLAVGVVPIQTAYLRLAITAEYGYQYTDGHNTDQDSHINWITRRGEIELQLQPHNSFIIKLAVDEILIDGEQHDSGTISQVLQFSEAERSGQRVGLELPVGNEGSVGLDYYQGRRDGGLLYFRRYFY